LECSREKNKRKEKEKHFTFRVNLLILFIGGIFFKCQVLPDVFHALSQHMSDLNTLGAVITLAVVSDQLSAPERQNIQAHRHKGNPTPPGLTASTF
jgi:hypothetical protein